MKYSKYISLISAIGDLLILNFYFNFAFCYLKGFNDSCFNNTAYLFFVFINIAWFVSATIFNTYKFDDRQVKKKKILSTYLKIIVFFFFLFLLFFQIVDFNYFSRDDVKILFVVFFLTLILWKFSLYYIFLVYRNMGYNYRNVIIVGYNDKATELKDYFNSNPWAGYRFKGFFTYDESHKKDVVGTYDDLEEFIVNNKVDEIYILISDLHKSIYKTISSIVGKHAVKIRLVPDLSDFSFMSLKLVDYDMIPVMKIQQGPLSFWYNRWLKRLFDIATSILIITLVLSWLIPLLLIINLFTDREGVFFAQDRSGLNNKPFRVIKFRTMKKNGDAHSKGATANDDRITTIGKFLRKTSIDELPQFFNVLIGNMSVVGPRPHMLKHTEEYKALVAKFMIRHAVKPGITGYAQVRGARGEIKKTKDIKARIKLDISYIENWSLIMDIKIVLITIGKIIKGDDKAY